MERRHFIRAAIASLSSLSSMLGSSCIAPDPAMAQNSVRKRRIGVLINLESTDPESRDRVSALTDGLKAAGWDMDRELEIEYRWTGGSPDLIRNAVRQLVEMKPDVILVAGYTATNQIRALDPSVQIVFTNVSNPVASGLIQNIASPGGNLTGFMTQLDWSIGAKWVDLLVEAKPTINRIAVLYDPTLSTGMGQRAAIEEAALKLDLEVLSLDVSDIQGIERQLLNHSTGTLGLIITASPFANSHRAALVSAAYRQGIPSISPYRYYALDGGLMSYGDDSIDHYRRAASYIDRILHGQLANTLPVQAPSKYSLVLNLKTAKSLGFKFPENLLIQADEVIE